MEPKKPCEREHDFTLVLDGVPQLDRKVMDALYEAGCDDATPSIRSGRMFLTFSRNAILISEAILSAISDVHKAKIGAEILRVDDCNLVTQSEIGHRSRRSRQQIHQYITGERGPGNFPPPACNINDNHSLWYWCEVANWLYENNLIKEEILRDAEEVAFINSYLEMEFQRKRHPELAKEFFESICEPCGA